MKKMLLIISALLFCVVVSAQDSAVVSIHPAYDRKTKFHRMLFGENYRKEWATAVKLPLIRISEFNGGLIPEKAGGGMQSKSLRLIDRQGREWVIRSVEKNPDAVIPEALRRSFARDWVDDATSAQHPFGALIIPPLANAVNVKHSHPLIGIIGQDSALGPYLDRFVNMVALVEEREPAGETDNTDKMKRKLEEDNDNSIDGKAMLRARLLDMLTGDWDRHEDQWRWHDGRNGKSKVYIPVPRDRDQVFHVTEGLIPRMVAREYILPTLRNFDSDIRRPEWVLFKSGFVNAYPSFQFTKEEWLAETRKFREAITDSVLEAALMRLPPEIYRVRHDELFRKLQSRREHLTKAISFYYDYAHKIADIKLSNKNELTEIGNIADGNIRLSVSKLNKQGEKAGLLMSKIYDPRITKEIRVYSGLGNDSLVNNTRKVRVRYIRDTLFTPVNLNNTLMPLIFAGLNIDDGFIFGAGFKYTRQEGFRKYPYASMHQLTAAHSFSTSAYRIKYNGEWIKVLGAADLSLQAYIRAPNNTINFFGTGNETELVKTEGFKRYHRTRFSTWQLDAAARWKSSGYAFSLGPSLYYYTFDADDNAGRFITHNSSIGTYDSSFIAEDKLHVGAAMQFVYDTRDWKVLPSKGIYLNMRVQGYKGMGKYASDFMQLIPEFSIYRSLSRSITVANRTGATVTIGRPAFYQSAFLGGHENLLGYRQYRFAGLHGAYNNLELRVKLAEVASYLLPGQFGVTVFWDAGRVWENHDNSGKLHHGTGAGIYFAPASLFVFNLLVGYSEEDFLPYFTMGMRF